MCSLSGDHGDPLTCGGLEADSCAVGLNHPKDLSVLFQSSHACRDQRWTSEEGMASGSFSTCGLQLRERNCININVFTMAEELLVSVHREDSSYCTADENCTARDPGG